jgi:hypothetical protein
MAMPKNTGTGVSINFKLKDFGQEVTEEVVKRTVEKAATYAKSVVRVDVGNLRQSITAESRGFVGEVYSDADYALDQEYGKPGVKSQIRPNTEPPAGPGGG